MVLKHEMYQKSEKRCCSLWSRASHEYMIDYMERDVGLGWSTQYFAIDREPDRQPVSV